MVSVPKKVRDRLVKGIGPFQKVLQKAKDRDVNESDTVTIITDMLSDVFGFDKYAEVTSEQAIRGTFCDLAVKVDDKIKYLIEVKAIGHTLKDNHLRQAVQYGSAEGIPWVVLTNGTHWHVYNIKFERPVTHEEICSFNFLELSSRKSEDIEQLFLLCKEGLAKDALKDFHDHVQIVNRFILAALIQADVTLDVLRREIKRLSPGIKVDKEELAELLGDVLKRDVMEGDSAAEARARVSRASGKALRKRVENRKDEAITPPTS